jgi:hypothetical protein
MAGNRIASGALLALLALGLTPRSAHAQPDAIPRVSIGGGAGVTLPFHGDFDFTPGTWEAGVRVALSRRAAFEGSLSEWRRTDVRRQSGVPVGVGASAGTIGQLEERTNRRMQSWEANVLRSWAAGRVWIWAGGGAGVIRQVRSLRYEAAQCTPAVASACGVIEQSRSTSSFSVQAVGGVDVPVTSRLAASATVRFPVPTRDPGGADLRFLAGVRWSFD